VETEKKDPNSILNYYQKLLALRHGDKALRDGIYKALNEDSANVLSYMRSYKGETVVVVLNMSGSTQKVQLDLAASGVKGTKAKTLLSSFEAPAQEDTEAISLEPFGAWIGEIE
jgi:alpha-glucosidase